mgnify:CR=1 FL=1
MLVIPIVLQRIYDKNKSLTATSRFNIINEVEKNIKVRPDTVR